MVKIALIQQRATDNLSDNLERGLNNARIAAENGANIICYAELAFTPFYPQHVADENHLELAETIPGPVTNAFSGLAKELGVVFVLNLYERDGKKAYDSSPVIGPDGSILGVTRMIHITEYEYFHEQGYYHPGDGDIKIYDTPFGKLGISICYDRHYPEYMRALALAGAEIIFIPQAGAIGEWPEGLYEAELQVAAFQNGYFTALCNRVGKEENLTFAGESFVCAPDGKVIARGKSLEEDIVYAEIDLEQVKNSHAKKLFLQHRRPELYRKWFQ
jgi:N-carbamoylputrescine amidase